MTAERRERILARTKELGALTYGDFTLSSGEKSTYYFDGRLLSLDPEGASLLGPEFLQVAIDSGAEAIGGLTLGADPIVGAVVLASGLAGSPITGFLVRGEAKGHGTGRQIEGGLPQDARVVIIEDSITSGGSALKAIEAMAPPAPRATSTMGSAQQIVPRSVRLAAAATLAFSPAPSIKKSVRYRC